MYVRCYAQADEEWHRHHTSVLEGLNFNDGGHQDPLFELLEGPKHRAVFEIGHGFLPRTDLIRRTVRWCDKHLGAVAPNRPLNVESAGDVPNPAYGPRLPAPSRRSVCARGRPASLWRLR